MAIDPQPKIDGWIIHLRVSRSWKTDSPEDISITTGTTCRYEAEPDREYLLFLDSMKTEEPWTGRCRGNGPLAEKAEAVRWLDKNGRKGRVNPRPERPR